MTTKVHNRLRRISETLDKQAPQKESVDLATPDAEAAALAEKLQTAQMNFMFSKAVLFIGKWIIRPLIWWPIKFFAVASFKIFVLSQPSKEIMRQNEEAQQQYDMYRIMRRL